ncbi:hypothetical protein F2Q70_00039080 [Brassica cretica]|uniref:Uncharacterized protein n=1 Tax=Brassica cretica TaxID=69181 RepID=A0A8S9K6T6_BRACR|nr:hypothetical protein F2Q70_00039080 [Brassica cretica]
MTRKLQTCNSVEEHTGPDFKNTRTQSTAPQDSTLSHSFTKHSGTQEQEHKNTIARERKKWNEFHRWRISQETPLLSFIVHALRPDQLCTIFVDTICNRDGGTRHSTGPYDRRKEQTWIVKSRRTDVSEVDQTGYDHGEASREIVPYEHVSAPSHVNNSAGGSSSKLASTIITPVREPPMVENVTLRTRGEARSLTFSPSRETEPSKAKDQIIEALHDMELVDQQDGDMLDAEGIEDDLLGVDLMEMEDNGCRDEPPEEKGRVAGIKSIRHMKLGVKQSAPLGIPSRKFEILRRGSPSKRSSSTGAHAPGAEIAIATSYYRQIFESSNPEDIADALS